MVKNLAWTFPEVLIMLRSVKSQIQGLSKSQISSDKLVPVGSGSVGLGRDLAKIRFGSDWANQYYESALNVVLAIKVYHQLKKKGGTKYEFILKGGESLLCALYNLFKTIWQTEEIPQIWRESKLTQLHKRGPVSSLSNFRFIHEKCAFYKYFSQLVMFHTKPKLYQNMPKNQIACVPGHRPSEHLFVVKSMIAYYHDKKKPMIFTS